MNYSKIDGHSDLLRDSNTNSIINTNLSEYEQYIARREAKEQKNLKIQSIEDEVANIKNDIDEIKFLLKELLNGSK
jgi:hypothetical protein